MKAMIATAVGRASEMQYAKVADPTPRSRPGIDRRQGRRLQFPDILIVPGQYQMKPPLPSAQGMSCRHRPMRWARGDASPSRSAGLRHDRTGRVRQRAVADDTRVLAIPDTMSYKEAAAFALVNQTSYSSSFTVPRASRAREWLLVHAARAASARRRPDRQGVRRSAP